MKLLSWNVNGARAAMKKGLRDFILRSDADAICLQEVRARREQVTLDLPDHHFSWNAGDRAGYSGTAILSKTEPLSVRNGIGVPEHDREGRVIAAEYDDFFLVTNYTPNAGRGLVRLDYRCDGWDPAFLAYCKELEAEKPIVLCGDLNVAHQEIDIARPKSNHKTAGFTPRERANFTRFLDAGFVDTFRMFTSEGSHYSWWSYRAGARRRNVGWRLDYFCVSENLRGRVRSSKILKDVMGSDHCPIELIID